MILFPSAFEAWQTYVVTQDLLATIWTVQGAVRLPFTKRSHMHAHIHLHIHMPRMGWLSVFESEYRYRDANRPNIQTVGGFEHWGSYFGVLI